MAEVLEQQDAHIVDGAPIAVELDPPRAVDALGHHADRQAARESAAVAGRQDPVARLHRTDAPHIVETRAAAAVAGEHGPRVGAFDQDRHARRHVGQQDHAADPRGDAGDAADHAVLAEHRIADAHALGSADVQKTGPSEGTARVGDGPAGRHGHGRLGLDAQHLLIAGIDVLQRQRLVAPGAHLDQFMAQPAVLGNGEEIALHIVDGAAAPAHWRGQDAPCGSRPGLKGRARGLQLIRRGMSAIGEQKHDGGDNADDHCDRGRPGQRHLQILERSVAKRHGQPSC
ncbi:hypothetical protein D3C73_959510 [compost metagenome]